MSRLFWMLPCLCLLLGAHSAWAQETDIQDYVRLATAAEGLLDLMETADPSRLPALREAAVEADLALLNWLDAFFLTTDFAAMAPHEQAAAYSDRYRWEHNLSVQLLALGRCQEARDRIRSLLGNDAFNDTELRPVLTQAYSAAVTCVERNAQADISPLHVEATPRGAEVLIDDTLAGTAPLDTQLSAGEHVVTIRAPGYVSQSHTVVAQGTALAVGPIALEAEVAPEEPGTGPRPLHWALWGVGLAGIGSGVALHVAARNREEIVDGPPDGYFVTDPPKERDLIDTFDTFAITSFGVGIAAAVAGTILYLTDDGDAGEAAPVSLHWFHDGRGAGLQLGVVWP